MPPHPPVQVRQVALILECLGGIHPVQLFVACLGSKKVNLCVVVLGAANQQVRELIVCTQGALIGFGQMLLVQLQSTLQHSFCLFVFTESAL